jgi:hypothetical protein
MIENVKKISKYTLNTLSIVAALIIAINAVEGIEIPYAAQITGVISAVNGVLSSYLLGDKAISKAKEKTK